MFNRLTGQSKFFMKSVEAPSRTINESETTESFGPKVYSKVRGFTEAICIGFVFKLLDSSLAVIRRL